MVYHRTEIRTTISLSLANRNMNTYSFNFQEHRLCFIVSFLE